MMYSEMQWKRWVKAVVKAVGVPLGDPRFLPHLYHTVENDRARMSDLGEVLTRPHLRLSEQLALSGVQDGAMARSRIRVRELVQILITAEGTLDLKALETACGIVEKHLYSLGPDRHPDTQAMVHLYRCLRMLRADDYLQRKLHALEAPSGNVLAGELIRQSLELEAHARVDRIATRRAVLSAWLTHLRQNVGSCFATAPAIMVQAEQPRLFFADLEQLLATGQIKRTFGGVEYVVPLCKSWGQGDLLRLFPTAAIDQFAHSPGLQAAFEATGLLKANESETHRIKNTRTLLKQRARHVHTPLVSTDALLRAVLMHAHRISSQELSEYESRVHAPTLTTLISTPSISGIGAKIEAYKKHLNAAQSAFKSVTDHPLLKAWEFTVASFSDVKADFSRWNLYAALGIDPNEKGGIGDAIKEALEEQIAEANRQIEALNARYEIAYAAVQMLESRMRAGTEDDARWTRTEHNQKIGELHTIDEERRQVSQRGQQLARLFRDLVDLYGRLFPDYFQEVYDPDMHDVGTHEYDDSPAGFRLLYKHGRANTALWTLIFTPDEWIQVLSDFFVATEGALLAQGEFSELEKEVSDLITNIITRIRDRAFLESAFDRAAIRHSGTPIADPLGRLEQIGKKPWSYVSGGTMTTLASAYFSRGQLPTVVDRVVESPSDLLVFFLDTLKELPATDTDRYFQDPMHSMLVQSPTHGFLLKPGLRPFCDGWTDKGNSSTWIRHHLVGPAQGVVEGIRLNKPMMRALLAVLAEELPPDFRPQFMAAFQKLPSLRCTVREFRNLVVSTLRYFPWIQQEGVGAMAAQVDATLYALLPFVEPQNVREAVVTVLQELLGHELQAAERAVEAFDDAVQKARPTNLVSSRQLQHLLQSCIILGSGQTTSGADLPWQIRALLRRHGLALAAPLLVADSNWSREFFGFVVNPGTSQLDFWRVDYLGLSGAPMAEWSHWLDGSHTVPWCLYTKPSEYTA